MEHMTWCDGSSNRSFMVDPLGYFSFQPVPHDWCNKGCGMCYTVWDDAYKRTLAANQKDVAAAGFLLLSEWSFTICLTLYNCK